MTEKQHTSKELAIQVFESTIERTTNIWIERSKKAGLYDPTVPAILRNRVANDLVDMLGELIDGGNTLADMLDARRKRCVLRK